MREHVTPWLNAYHDGELRGRKLALVEAHLAGCPECRAELDRYEQLSAMLEAAPDPQISTSADNFVAQVGMRLPRLSHRPTPARWQTALQWYFVPLGSLAAIGFLQSISLVAGLLTWIERLGFSTQSVSWLLPEPASSPNLIQQATAWLFGWGLPFNSPMMVSLVLPVLIGAGYLLWLLLWWMRQEQDEQQQVLNSLKG